MALRRQGHEVVFALSSEMALDRPENNYPELRPPYPEWIHDYAPMWKTYFPTPWRPACIRALRNCDFVVLNQIGPSLAGLIGRPAVALLTGSDLQVFADPRSIGRVFAEKHRQNAFVAVPLKLLT